MKNLKSITEFCQQTTLHGWSYIVNEESIWAKFFWAISQLAFVTIAIYLMTINVIVYMNSTTKTSLESTTSSLDDLAFPGIFLCNYNQMEASFINQLTQNESWSSSFKDKVKQSFYKQFINGKTSKYDHLVHQALKVKFNWTEMIPIREISSPSCGQDMFLLVKSKRVQKVGYQYAYR